MDPTDELGEIAAKLNADLGPKHILVLELGEGRRPTRLERLDGKPWQGVVAYRSGEPPEGFRLVANGTLYPHVSVFIDGELISTVGPPAVWNIADAVQDGISERIAFGVPWPPCPITGTHPMNFEGSSASWRCAEHGVEVPLGSVHAG